MKLISERSVNLDIYPVINSDYTEIIKNENLIFSSKPNYNWSARCYNFMDLLSTRVQNKNLSKSFLLYNKIITYKSDKISEFCPLLKDPNQIYTLANEFKNGTFNNPLYYIYETTISMSLKDIRSSGIFPPSISKVEIIDVIKKCSSFQFKTYFHFATIWNDKINYISNYLSSDYENLFNYTFDGKKFDFNFNTAMGILFIHNIRMNGFSTVDNNTYSLNQFTNILYRKKILQSPLKTMKIDINSISECIGINCKNRWHVKKMITTCFEELNSKKLISIKKFDGTEVECSRLH